MGAGYFTRILGSLLCCAALGVAAFGNDTEVICTGDAEGVHVDLSGSPSPPCAAFDDPSLAVLEQEGRAVLRWLPPRTIHIETSSDTHAVAPSETLELRLPRQRPADFRLTLEQDAAWTMIPPPDAAVLLVTLPPGEWQITASAEKHQPWRTRIEVPTDDRVHVPLLLIPAIRGVIRTSPGLERAVGALVKSEEEAVLAVTDQLGTFEIRPYPRPDILRIESPGYATEHITVPRTQSDYQLPTITLEKAGTVLVSVTAPDGSTASDIVTIRLMRREPDNRWIEFRRAIITSPQTSTTLSGLPPDSYRVLIEGDDPLERSLQHVEVTPSSEEEVEFILRPATVAIEVAIGDEELGSAELVIAREWEEPVRLSPAGTRQSRTWEHGEYLVVVNHPELTIPYVSTEVIADEDETWNIVVPESGIKGSVRSSKGEPIARAKVVVSAQGRGASFIMPTTTDAAGTFSFTGVTGTAVVTAEAEGYEPSDPVTVLVADEQQATADLVLTEQPSERMIRVTDTLGRPRAGTIVLLTAGEVLLDDGVTKDDGTVKLALPTSRASSVFVVDRAGGFGVAHFAANNDEVLITIVVPSANCNLEIRTAEAGSRAPIGGVSFLMRYNFTTIPGVVRAVMQQAQGRQFTTDQAGTITMANLPPGFFELLVAQQAGVPEWTPSTPAALEMTAGSYRLDLLLEPASEVKLTSELEW